jgi:hypothetical protein
VLGRGNYSATVPRITTTIQPVTKASQKPPQIRGTSSDRRAHGQRHTHSTALYVEGIPHLPIREVKQLLAAAPVRIQLRHVRNVSWIDRRLVELLVDSNHLVKMQNRINNYSKYQVKTAFDPLSPRSFSWKGDILPESQESMLKNNFVERLGASVAASSNTATREHIMCWARNRGLGPQLEKLLIRQGIRLPQPTGQNDQGAAAAIVTEVTDSRFAKQRLSETACAETTASRKRRHSLADSGLK